MRRDLCVDIGAVSIVCLCVYLTSFLPFFRLYFLLSLCFLSYLFASLLVYLLTYLSISSRIDPFRFQAGGHRRRPILPLVVFWFILCCSIFCYGCMFAFVAIV